MAERGRKKKVWFNGGYLSSEFYDKEIINEIINLTKLALSSGAEIAAEAVKQETPSHTGRMKNAAGFKIAARKSQYYARVGFFGKKQAKKQNGRAYFANPWWIDKGVKPHAIAPLAYSAWFKGKQAGDPGRSNAGLKKLLTNKSSGKIYGRAVKHPGYQARPFVAKAVLSRMPKIIKANELAVANLNKSVDELIAMPRVREEKGDI